MMEVDSIQINLNDKNIRIYHDKHSYTEHKMIFNIQKDKPKENVRIIEPLPIDTIPNAKSHDNTKTIIIALTVIIVVLAIVSTILVVRGI